MVEKVAARTLVALLNGEISAVEAYDHAGKLLPTSEIGFELTQLSAEHTKRVRKLRRRMRQLGTGGSAAVDGSGFVFPKLENVKRTDLELLKVLRDAEQEALIAYQDSLSRLDDMSRSLVALELIPEQELTENVVATLCDGLKYVTRLSA